MLLALMVWREARGVRVAWPGIVWTVLNRALYPTWSGQNVVGVITEYKQFSSMTAPGDPNLVKWPKEYNPEFLEIQDVIFRVLAGQVPDPTKGATYYWTAPLTTAPAAWGKVVETVNLGGVHFCKAA
jgi:spore germination cell wall hydrolase CwlJ-like protein